MGLKIETACFGVRDEYSGYLCRPDRASGPLPGLIVIQEIWGVDDHIEDVTRRFAAAGYAALAVDLYSRNAKRPEALARPRVAQTQKFFNGLPMTAWFDEKARETELSKLPGDERAAIAETFGALFGPLLSGAGLDYESHLPPLAAAMRFLQQDNALTRNQKLGAVGFCMGGALSALLACREPLDACVVFYGAPPSEERIPGLRCPVLGFYGALDTRLNDGLPVFEAAMKKHGKSLEKVVFAGAGHAFFNDNRPSYHVRAAREAFARALGFLRERLADVP